MSYRGAIAALLVSAVTVPPGAHAAAPFVDADELIRRVVKTERVAEQMLAAYTYDQLEVATKFAKRGVPKDTEARLYYVFSGDAPGEGSRELVSVNGRPATIDEKQKVVAEDAKSRKRSLERRAAARARKAPGVGADEDDPLVGAQRLSNLLAHYHYWIEREEVRDGRLCYVLRFSPRHGLKSRGLAEQALSALAGEIVVDGTDYQVRALDAILVSPVKVAGGIAARVDDAVVRYEAEPIASSHRWFPCSVDLRLRGKTAIFLRLDVGYRYQFTNFRTFRVETESSASEGPPGGD
jgi:hypothetical protein